MLHENDQASLYDIRDAALAIEEFLQGIDHTLLCRQHPQQFGEVAFKNQFGLPYTQITQARKAFSFLSDQSGERISGF